MAKQTFTTGQVLTAAQMTSLQQTAMLGGAASAKTASYTLVAADAGTAISMNSASATTITVNTALFAAGDTVQITNLGAGVCTITAGTATVNSSASLALAQYESGTLDFTSTSAAIFIKGAGAAAASGGMTLLSTTNLSGTTTTVSGISGSYKDLLIIVNDPYTNSGNNKLRINPNGNASTVYAAGTSASASAAVFPTNIDSENTNSASAPGYAVNRLYINQYANTTYGKTFAWVGVGKTSSEVIETQGVINTTSAISSLAFTTVAGTNSFSGGQVLIYGVS